MRAARLFFERAPPGAPDIPQVLLDKCRVLSTRDALLYHLPRAGTVAEVGTQQGHFARRILDVCDPARLDLIDLDLSDLRSDVHNDPRVKLHGASSQAALASFGDESFDWIYIDADHSYRGVIGDIAAAAPKVRTDGYLVFNDFARIVRPNLGTFGVHQAVCEFIVKERWPVAFFCMQTEAAYDIALKKPSRRRSFNSA